MRKTAVFCEDIVYYSLNYCNEPLYYREYRKRGDNYTYQVIDSLVQV